MTPVEIRRATPADLGAVRELLSRRDERPWDDDAVRWFVHGLADDRCTAWLATAGARPVGLTTLFLRRLRGPEGELRAGYWANLYVDPDHRDRMLYPRLPLAMLKAVPALGLELVYASVRRGGLAPAHERLGFARLGTLPVLVDALRPGRLVALYRGRSWAAPLLAPADLCYRALLGARRARQAARARASSPDSGVEIAALPWDGARAGELAGLLAAGGSARIRESWTAESLSYRYRRTREGSDYFLVGALAGGRLVGAVIYREAERLGGIRAAVILDVIAAPGAERRLAGVLLEVERRALAAGCDLLLFLDGLGPETSALLRASGYRPSPEIYEFLVWPAARAAAGGAVGRLESWRFGFGDHDAF